MDSEVRPFTLNYHGRYSRWRGMSPLVPVPGIRMLAGFLYTSLARIRSRLGRFKDCGIGGGDVRVTRRSAGMVPETEDRR